MSTHPLISVIIPTYNRETSLLDAIRSIEAQSFQDFEIIIVDDGSTDHTKRMILSLENIKIRYFYQGNQGVSVARNIGIEKSYGKYIAFLDSDDYWFRDKLNMQAAFLEKENNHYHGCITGYYLHTLNGQMTPIVPLPERTSLREILWKNILHPCTTLMCNRKVFNEIGYFDKNLRRGQDTDWLIHYRNKFEIGIIPETLAVFNQHLSRSGEAMEKSRLYFLEKHKAILLEQGSVFYRKKVADIYRDLAYQFSRESNSAKAHEYSRKAVLTYPSFSPGLWLILIDVHFGTQLKKKMDSIKYPGSFK